MAFIPSSRRMLGKLVGVNLNSTADQAIDISSSKYIIMSVYAMNASTTPTLAAGGLYTAASKGGTLLVGTGQIYTGLTAAAKYNVLTLAAVVGTDVLTATTLYFSLTTANGSACTCDLYIFGETL